VIVVAWTGGFLLKAILQFQLGIRCKTVAGCDVNPTQILAPAGVITFAVGDIAEELLVPTERAKELRGEFIFCFKIVSKCIRIANAGNFEARSYKLRPQLQEMPGKRYVLGAASLTYLERSVIRRIS
jgi:hypothetical protein